MGDLLILRWEFAKTVDLHLQGYKDCNTEEPQVLGPGVLSSEEGHI